MFVLFCRDHQWVASGEKKMTGGSNFQTPAAGMGVYGQQQPGMMPGQMVNTLFDRGCCRKFLFSVDLLLGFV